jgi:hypothetical protein
MIPRTMRPDSTARFGFPAALACAAALAILVAACDKVPLLAPTGSVITLFPSATTVPANGEIEIVATVIEQGTTAPPPGTGNGTGAPTTTSTPGSGTPVHNGTLVSFTTTIGRIEPAEARTQNGQVRVKFLAAGQSGTATITAFSGGASGRIENLRVGTAAAERVIVTASPQTLSPSGGTTQIAARVETESGIPLPGVPVTFTSDAGLLNPSSASTDQEGIARTTLTTTQRATVTANVAGRTEQVTIGLNPRTGISITAPTGQVSAGQPAAFTIGVNSEANIQDVSVNFGDGTTRSLGALSGSTTVQHTYSEAGSYTARATAREASGFTESVATSLTVLPGQPPGVTIMASNSAPTVGETVILTANVTGATSTIQRYEWTFGAGADRPSAVTTGNQVPVTYSTTGTKVIIVNVIQATGPAGNGSTSVVVRAGS